MNLQFENRYYSNHAMISEYVHKVLCKRIYQMAAIFVPIALFMTIISLNNQDYIMTAVFGVCLFIIVFTVLVSPILTIKQLKETDRQMHNGKNPEAVVQFGDNISISQGTFTLSIDYSQVIKTYQLKHSFVLMFAKGSGVMIDPKGFTTGDFHEFKEFIQSKCKGNM